ncbi:MAG TPA: homoserine kinase [Dehalococcoidia bacterium]|nr:homoserine kinase [Dehalococcoidia bacterium]
MKISVRVPATTANLGPGFDCLGLALDLWATVTVETTSKANDPEPRSARLVRQGIEAVFESAGKAPELTVSWDATVPIARGLGASAALRVAGLLAGNALLGGVHNAETLLEMGTKLEGHPDNVAPCMFGGLQINVRPALSLSNGSEGGVVHLASPLPDGLQVVLFVPEFEMPTQESRRRLPRQLSREDAVFNLSHVALLVAALAAGRFDLLDEATQDRLHQPIRGEIFAGLKPIMAAAKDGGAAAAYLSGAGSTVAAFVEHDAERVARLMTQAALAHGFSGRSLITKPTSRSAHIVQ